MRRFKRLIVSLMVVSMMGMGLTTAFAGPGGDGNGQGPESNNGQAIGQDEFRLAITRCSNAGLGNEGEYEVGFLFYAVESECLHEFLVEGKRGGYFYTWELVQAVFAQSDCYEFPLIFACEVDPGNSAAHNANNN